MGKTKKEVYPVDRISQRQRHRNPLLAGADAMERFCEEGRNLRRQGQPREACVKRERGMDEKTFHNAARLIGWDAADRDPIS